MITLIEFLIISAFTINASTEYEEAMKMQLRKLDSASSISQYQEVVNGFDRIGKKEKEEWLPFYYVSYGYSIMSAREEDSGKRDDYLALSQSYLDQVRPLGGDLSEVEALQGFIYMLKVAIDPAARGPEYSPLSFASLAKSLKINPENPRATYLMARVKYGQAEFFGEDTSEACKMAARAKVLLEKEQRTSILLPHWGRKQIASLIAKCK